MKIFPVGEVARHLGVAPKVVSDALYRGAVRDELAPVVAGRRLVHESAIPILELALRRAGKLPLLAVGKGAARD